MSWTRSTRSSPEAGPVRPGPPSSVQPHHGAGAASGRGHQARIGLVGPERPGPGRLGVLAEALVPCDQPPVAQLLGSLDEPAGIEYRTHVGEGPLVQQQVVALGEYQRDV